MYEKQLKQIITLKFHFMRVSGANDFSRLSKPATTVDVQTAYDNFQDELANLLFRNAKDNHNQVRMSLAFMRYSHFHGAAIVDNDEFWQQEYRLDDDTDWSVLRRAREATDALLDDGENDARLRLFVEQDEVETDFNTRKARRLNRQAIFDRDERPRLPPASSGHENHLRTIRTHQQENAEHDAATLTEYAALNLAFANFVHTNLLKSAGTMARRFQGDIDKAADDGTAALTHATTLLEVTAPDLAGFGRRLDDAKRRYGSRQPS